MKKILLIFLGFALGWIGALFQNTSFFTEEKEEYANFPVIEEKPFVILIPSYNNSAYVEKNLHSVFSQNYENFRVIYIDDASSDDTLEKATKLINQLDEKGKSILIHNPVHYGALANLYNAVHRCQNHEIVIVLNGDDFLAHEGVLHILNQAYASPKTWTTYSQLVEYPSFKFPEQLSKKIPKKIIKNQRYRKYPWVTSSLHSFYASLFKQIKIEDLYYRGQFYPMGWEHAIFFPILEMASTHVTYIPEVLYLSNGVNPIKDHKINLAFQTECTLHIRNKKPYPPIKNLPASPSLISKTADLILFSNDRPLDLLALLESIHLHLSKIGNKTVFYQNSNDEIEKEYLQLQDLFPSVQFLKIDSHFKNIFEKVAFETLSESSHLLIGQDTLMIKNQISIEDAIDALETSHAYALYFDKHLQLQYSQKKQCYQPLPTFTPLPHNFFGWQFSEGTLDWNSPNSFDFALYRKEDLKKTFTPLLYISPETLLSEWGNLVSKEAIGLIFPEEKTIPISSEVNSKVGF